MTTELTNPRPVAQATHQGIEQITITVSRNTDMSVNADESSIAVLVAEYDQGEIINRRQIRRTLAEMNAGGSALQQLKTETRGYYQFLEQLARNAGIIGQGTDSEDFS